MRRAVMMHEDQVHIDLRIARQLIDDDFAEFRAKPIELIDSQGTVNAIYRVGANAAARFPLCAADPAVVGLMLRKEADASTEFARSSPFAAPRPLGLGRPGRTFPMPWAMQTWIEGDVATPAGNAASDAFAHDIATLLESLRAVDTQGRSFDGEGRGGRIADHDEWMNTCLTESRGLVDVAVLRSMWHALRMLPPAERVVMSHRDLTPANVLARDDRIVGILETGGFGPADCALDLVAVWHMLDADRRDLVRSRLRVARAEWLRGAAWAFAQAMGLVWYYRHTNPSMSALGRSTLQRLIEDPEIPR